MLKGTGELLGSTTVSTRLGGGFTWPKGHTWPVFGTGVLTVLVYSLRLVLDCNFVKASRLASLAEDVSHALARGASRLVKVTALRVIGVIFQSYSFYIIEKRTLNRVRTVGETITAALKTMGVRGRDAMVRQAERESAEDAVQEDASPRGCCRLLSTLCACWAWGASDATGAPLRQGTEVEADTAQGRLDAIKRDQEVLGAFYQHLLAPVEAHLAGATEVLIIPHKELFEVPWAALFDSQTGQYLIQRCVLRVAPSLCVARTAADTLRGTNGAEEKGHALVVGNPLPTRSVPLPKAEVEAEFVAELLSGEGFEVHALMGQAATKADVQSKIEGAKWAHLACHGNFDHHVKGPHILLADLSLLPGTFLILYPRFPR